MAKRTYGRVFHTDAGAFFISYYNGKKSQLYKIMEYSSVHTYR